MSAFSIRRHVFDYPPNSNIDVPVQSREIPLYPHETEVWHDTNGLRASQGTVHQSKERVTSQGAKGKHKGSPKRRQAKVKGPSARTLYPKSSETPLVPAISRHKNGNKETSTSVGELGSDDDLEMLASVTPELSDGVEESGVSLNAARHLSTFAVTDQNFRDSAHGVDVILAEGDVCSFQSNICIRDF